MTRQELRDLYDRRTALFASEQTLTELTESCQLAGNSELLESRIEELRQHIQGEHTSIAELDIRAADTLKGIKDCRARIGAKLHYLEGMPWEVAAAVIGYTSEAALRQIVYRGFRAANIK